MLGARRAQLGKSGLAVKVAARGAKTCTRAAVATVMLAAATMATTALLTLATGAIRPAAASQARGLAKYSPGCTVPRRLARGQIVVAVVADFGGDHGRVIVSCVLARPGESGAEVLASQAALLGDPEPRYAQSGSGLLCAIDGYPAGGCGIQSGTHYAYWAYWHGGKRWQYASDGPSEWTVVKGDVEGWRFEPDGSATPSDPPPRAPSSAAALERQAGATRGSSSAKQDPNQAAGPIDQSHGGGSGSSTLPFVVGLVLITLIGTAGIFRSRSHRERVT